MEKRKEREISFIPFLPFGHPNKGLVDEEKTPI